MNSVKHLEILAQNIFKKWFHKNLWRMFHSPGILFQNGTQASMLISITGEYWVGRYKSMVFNDGGSGEP